VTHRNAPLTPTGRLLLCRRIEAGQPVAHVAAAMGISRQCAHKWWNRYQELGAEGLSDRSSRPLRSPNRTNPRTEERIVRRRRLDKKGPDRIAAQLGLSASTVYRVLVRHDCNRLSHLDRQSGGDPLPRAQSAPASSSTST
jgi:transposase